MKHALTLLTALLLAPPAGRRAAETPKLTLVAEPARVDWLPNGRSSSSRERMAVSSSRQRCGTAKSGGRCSTQAGLCLRGRCSVCSRPLHHPTAVPDRKVVEFSGCHRHPDYDWTMRVEAAAGSPLFRFVITCQLIRDYSVDSEREAPTRPFERNP